VPYERIDFVHPALDLVNSQHGIGRDLLRDRTWLTDYLERWGYADADAPDVKALSELRGLMRRIVEIVADGGSPADADLQRLNAILRRGRLAPELAADGGELDLRLVPARRDQASVRAQLAKALAELLSEGDRDRLKVCDNPKCRFAFYDRSRNRSRRWCSHTTCGNLDKVTRFRARRRGERYSASR
jgi:predicted RNA-binding Zn ribbon-like protein